MLPQYPHKPPTTHGPARLATGGRRGQAHLIRPSPPQWSYPCGSSVFTTSPRYITRTPNASSSRGSFGSSSGGKCNDASRSLMCLGYFPAKVLKHTAASAPGVPPASMEQCVHRTHQEERCPLPPMGAAAAKAALPRERAADRVALTFGHRAASKKRRTLQYIERETVPYVPPEVAAPPDTTVTDGSDSGVAASDEQESYWRTAMASYTAAPPITDPATPDPYRKAFKLSRKHGRHRVVAWQQFMMSAVSDRADLYCVEVTYSHQNRIESVLANHGAFHWRLGTDRKTLTLHQLARDRHILLHYSCQNLTGKASK